MALILNGDTIPYNTAFTFAGQPVHQVDVCYRDGYGKVTVWSDTEAQGRIRMTWDSLVFPAVSCTYSNVADKCECRFGGMRMQYCGDCAYTRWQRCNYWCQCLTGHMCIDCVAGITGNSYSVRAYPTSTICFDPAFGRDAIICYNGDKTVNLTWSTGDGCSYTMETTGPGGDCRYYPKIHTEHYGYLSNTFCTDVAGSSVDRNCSYSSSFAICLCTDLYISAGDGYGIRPVELQKTGRTYPLSMTMCRGPIDLSSCFTHYYVTVDGNKVSDANGNAICFTRAQLTNGICVNFATAKLIN